MKVNLVDVKTGKVHSFDKDIADEILKRPLAGGFKLQTKEDAGNIEKKNKSTLKKDA